MRIIFFVIVTSAFYFIQTFFVPEPLKYPTLIAFISLLSASILTESLRIKGSWWSFGIRPDKYAFKNILSGAILALISVAIILIFFLMMGAEIRFAGLRYQFSYYFFFALLFLLSAFSEELFFRGVIFQAFMDEHKYIAAVIMSMLFSLSHLLNPNVNFIGLINVFLVGLLLSFMFIESLSLWLPVTFHFLWNLLEELALDSPVSGYRTGINIFVINIDNSPGFIKFFFGGEFGLEAGFVTTIIIMINFVLVHKLAVYSPVQAANMFKKNYYESLFITNNKVLR